MQEQIAAHAQMKLGAGCGGSEEEQQPRWHADLFPASKKFVVYHVIKQDAGKMLDELNNHHYESRWEGDNLLPKVHICAVCASFAGFS